MAGFDIVGSDSAPLGDTSTDTEIFAITYKADGAVDLHLLHNGTQIRADGRHLKAE